MHGIVKRNQLHRSIADKVERGALKRIDKKHEPSFDKKVDNNIWGSISSSDGEDPADDSDWKLELAWLTKALEPALQLCRWALPTGLLIV